MSAKNWIPIEFPLDILFFPSIGLSDSSIGSTSFGLPGALKECIADLAVDRYDNDMVEYVTSNFRWLLILVSVQSPWPTET